jgi:hypothetical protein
VPGLVNVERYPTAANMLSAWKRGVESGSLLLPVGQTGEAVDVEWVRYEPPEYFLGKHCLGTFRFRDRLLRVRDVYRYHSITNSGERRWESDETRTDGLAACGELVMAAERGRKLVLREERGRYRHDVRVTVDQSFHEIESDDYGCVVELDVEAGELRLERSYFRDAST